jgi:DNA-binding transcriptional ArsR family regulator
VTAAVVSGPVRPFDIALLTAQRREILAFLGQERTVGEIADHFPRVTRSAVSQQLTVLLEARLVTWRRDERDGRVRWYRADRWALRELFLETWGELVP